MSWVEVVVAHFGRVSEENGEDDVGEGEEAEVDQGETTTEKGYRVEANDE